MTPPAQVLSRGWYAFSSITVRAASAGSRAARRRAVAAPAGPEPTITTSCRSIRPASSATGERLPPHTVASGGGSVVVRTTG